MNSFRRDWLLFVPALVVPAAALLLAAPRSERPVSPFATQQLMAAQLLAGLPLAILAAGWLSARLRVPAGVWAGMGAALAGLTVAAGAEVGPALDADAAGFTARAAVRFLWCLALGLPWCLFAWRWSRTAPPVEGWATLAAAAVAVLLPGALATHLVDRQTQEFEERIRKGRYTQALAVAELLCELGSDEPLGGYSPLQARQGLSEVVISLEQAVGAPLPADAPPRAVLARATQLAQLDRLAEAEALLVPLADADASAALLLGAVCQGQERWDASSRAYRLALDTLLPHAAERPDALTGSVRAYDGLAFNARGRKDNAAAESIYREALQRLPQAAAHFHLELGRLLYHADRPAAALAEVQTAVKLNPSLAEAARPILRGIRRHTPGCVLPKSG